MSVVICFAQGVSGINHHLLDQHHRFHKENDTRRKSLSSENRNAKTANSSCLSKDGNGKVDAEDILQCFPDSHPAIPKLKRPDGVGNIRSHRMDSRSNTSTNLYCSCLYPTFGSDGKCHRCRKTSSPFVVHIIPPTVSFDQEIRNRRKARIQQTRCKECGGSAYSKKTGKPCHRCKGCI